MRYGRGRQKGGAKATPLLDFEYFSKKVVFLVSSEKNRISLLLAP